MNYLDRLLQRAAGGAEVMRPRTPARFEPAAGAARTSGWDPAFDAVTEMDAPPSAAQGHRATADHAPAAPGRGDDGGAAGSPSPGPAAAPALRPRPARLLPPGPARPVAEADVSVTPDSAVPPAGAPPPGATPLRPRNLPPLAWAPAAPGGPEHVATPGAAVRQDPGDPVIEATAPPAARRDAPDAGLQATRGAAPQAPGRAAPAPLAPDSYAPDDNALGHEPWSSDRPAPFLPPPANQSPAAAPGPAPVVIEIGTIEFRAPPAPAAPAPPAAPRGPAVSLTDYLARRGARRGP